MNLSRCPRSFHTYGHTQLMTKFGKMGRRKEKHTFIIQPLVLEPLQDFDNVPSFPYSK